MLWGGGTARRGIMGRENGAIVITIKYIFKKESSTSLSSLLLISINSKEKVGTRF